MTTTTEETSITLTYNEVIFEECDNDADDVIPVWDALSLNGEVVGVLPKEVVDSLKPHGLVSGGNIQMIVVGSDIEGGNAPNQINKDSAKSSRQYIQGIEEGIES
jgi:hypothetical protein